MALDADKLAAKLAHSRAQETRQRVVAKPPDIHRATPQSEDAEKGILSSMMQDPEIIPEIHRLVLPYLFYTPRHKTVHQALMDLYESGEKLDMITLSQALRDKKLLEGVGGVGYLAELQTFVPTSANVHDYIAIAREKAVMRELITTGTQLVKATFGTQSGEDLLTVLDDFTGKLERIKSFSGGPNGSEPFSIAQLRDFDARHDPGNLIGHRWLVRGAPSLLAGGSGYGKSSLGMQLAITWACGKSWVGLRPVRPMKSLIIQAENDLGDMAEQLQGVLKGIGAAGDLDLDEMGQQIERNVGIHRVVGKTGLAFLSLLDALIEQDRPDIVWVDPLFGFSGCDLMNAEKAGKFLREGLFPIAVKRKVGLIVVHHVGKPPRKENQDAEPMSEIDYQYLGFGSSEIQNAFRSVNILLPVKGTNVFKLVLSKRGERAGAKDLEGEWTRTIFLEHSTEGIYWNQTEKPEQKKSGRKTEFTQDAILDELSVIHPIKTTALYKRLREEQNMSRTTFYNLLNEVKKDGKIKISEGGWIKAGKIDFSKLNPESPE